MSANTKQARGNRRPPGWTAPGPQPLGDQGDPTLQPGPEEDLSFLTGDFRIFQMKHGHRWSLDDFLTAYVAKLHGGTHVQTALDIGCGIGSVLQMVAWMHPQATLQGVEAQAVSFGLATRSLRYNGLADRVTVLHGDLRDAGLPLAPDSFDLITGTPPYFPEGHGIPSEKVQKGPCCFETRGGIEEYCAAAMRYLSTNGIFVCCAGPYPEQRGPHAAAAVGLEITHWVDAVPRRGKPVLFRVLVMRRRSPSNSEALPPVQTMRTEFVVRERDGTLSTSMHHARDSMGLPPSQERAAYPGGVVPG